ncbi:uncharacterized protein [Typha angustifolia]|uniref:uncharacterized protein n=1 Tax=Typha angustifolia TaxID=59011 RepID=UPI003C30422B
MARASRPENLSAIRCDIPELKRDNYKAWKERVLLHLGWLDIDYAIRKDEPPAITATSSSADIALYERWERSNRLSVFITSEKALASTLIMEFSSLRLTNVKGVREHIMQMRDIAAQFKKLEVEMSETFLVHYILNTLPQ